MYYKEEIINGILHYKTTPNGEWQEVSKETLSIRTKEAETKVYELTQLIEKLNKVVALMYITLK